MLLDYGKMLAEGFAQRGEGESPSRLVYLSRYIFDFTTYDEVMDRLFVRRAIEVCSAISNRTTFHYIKDDDQYRWYVLMVNMPFFSGRLNWGGSIRGAWWDTPPRGFITFSSTGLWINGAQLYEPIEFTLDQWREFIAAVIEFGTTDPLEAR